GQEALDEEVVKAGASFRFRPGTVHRVTALEDTTILEVSTPHLDDVVRLEDRYGREGTRDAGAGPALGRVRQRPRPRRAAACRRRRDRVRRRRARRLAPGTERGGAAGARRVRRLARRRPEAGSRARGRRDQPAPGSGRAAGDGSPSPAARVGLALDAGGVPRPR